MNQKKDAKARYEELKSRRSPFLERARLFAELTIPSLLPREGQTAGSVLPEAYSGLGARAVSNLSSRLLTALLPPGQSFFRLTVSPETLVRESTMDIPPEVAQNLAKVELLATNEVERRFWRSPTNLALQLLIVTGNALEQVLEDNTLRVFRLDQYVVSRSPNGELKEVIVCEMLSPTSLDEKLQAVLQPGFRTDDPNAKVALYTWVRLVDGKWEAIQYLEDRVVPESEGAFEKSPFNALRWAAVPGEDYGRGKVEEHYADFRALEGLSKAMLEGAAMAARNVILVRPNAAGGNLRQRMAKAKNGDVLVGNTEDVNMLQFQNQTGLQITREEANIIRQDIAAAFLLNSALRRDAERVTAQELRMVAEELDGVLGGVYSLLSAEMQRARVERLLFQMQKRNQLPPMPAGVVEPIITTGLEALGRERDLARINAASAFLNGMGDDARKYVKFPVLLGKAFQALQLPDAVRTEKEVEEAEQRSLASQAIAGAAETAASTAMSAPEAPMTTQ